ncbi:MAG: META domain-containing protein, partial [Acidobacteriota bacterium]|nr:META domain-containing protein [Acidobacteriota bacterium]
VSRQWELGADGLREAEPTTTGRLSIETIAGAEWVLRAWDLDEPAPAAPEVTLMVDGDRLSGSSGCNRYNATVKAGEAPGELSIGPMMSTRMACPEPEMAVETRFGRQMGAVRKMQFVVGRLVLTFEKNGSFGAMAFERRAPPAP